MEGHAKEVNQLIKCCCYLHEERRMRHREKRGCYFSFSMHVIEEGVVVRVVSLSHQVVGSKQPLC